MSILAGLSGRLDNPVLWAVLDSKNRGSERTKICYPSPFDPCVILAYFFEQLEWVGQAHWPSVFGWARLKDTVQQITGLAKPAFALEPIYLSWAKPSGPI